MNKTKYIILTIVLCFFLAFVVYPLTSTSATTTTTKYSCNTSTWKCEEDPNGYPWINKQACQNNCYLGAKYSCSTNYKICFANGVNGQYASLSDCEANCIVSTMKYSCNQLSWKCFEDSNGVYSSLTTCEAECIEPPITPTTTRYSCNTNNRTCFADPNGMYASLSACEDICFQTPAMGNRYYCDAMHQICYEKADGPYSSLAKCLNDCVKVPVPRYDCKQICSKDPITGLTSCNMTCVPAPDGQYSPIETCERSCGGGGWPSPEFPGSSCPGNDYCYKCNKVTLQCYASKEGAYINLHNCVAACKDPGPHYGCKRSTQTCILFPGCPPRGYSGAFSTLSKCEKECAKKPQWSCHISGSCWLEYIDPDQPFRYFSSKEECNYECPEMERTDDGKVIKYKCVVKSGFPSKCYPNVLTSAGYWTRRTCEANCPPKYTCNTSTWKCDVDSNGKYSTLAECGQDCKPKYSCDPSTWTCYVDSNGYFSTKNQCEFRCKKPLTVPWVPRYSCDKSTRTCYVDTPHGAWSPLSTCEYMCQPGSQIIQCINVPYRSGLSNPRCWSCDLATCTCYQNTDGKYGNLHQCFEWGCTPERCAAGATPSCGAGSGRTAPSGGVITTTPTQPPGTATTTTTKPSITTGCGGAATSPAPSAEDSWDLDYWLKFWLQGFLRGVWR